MTNSYIATTLTAAAFAVTATSIDAATINPFETTKFDDNGYSMLGDQTPNSNWVVNPVKNDETGAVMCVASEKLNNSVVTDAEGAVLDADAIDDLNINARYILVTPTAEGQTNDILIRTGYGIADITLIGAENRDIEGTANDAVFASAIPTTITATSDHQTDPHTFTDQISPFPEQKFTDCNITAVSGGFNATFAAAEQDSMSIMTLGTSDEINPTSLPVKYADSFIPATSEVAAKLSRGKFRIL